jgi:hypothetical protein
MTERYCIRQHEGKYFVAMITRDGMSAIGVSEMFDTSKEAEDELFRLYSQRKRMH